MLGRIRNCTGFKFISLAMLLCGATLLSSCASKPPAPLVADPSVAGRESALPWNEQQKWEAQGQFPDEMTNQRH